MMERLYFQLFTLKRALLNYHNGCIFHRVETITFVCSNSFLLTLFKLILQFLADYE